MLTAIDLKQIQKIVHEETRKTVKEEFVPIKKDVATIKKDIVSIRGELDPVKKNVATIKKDIIEIRKDIKGLVGFFDREYLDLRKRVERIENHLSLPPISN